jgi:hypothetical protein
MKLDTWGNIKMSSTLDKFIAISKELRISEIDSNELFENFLTLDEKYKNILKYDYEMVNIFFDVRESLINDNIVNLNYHLIITMTDEKKDEIIRLMSDEEKKAFYNLIKDYLNLSVERYIKEKSL